ncbi:MBL fold metallo-hydrolase [Nocardioides aestuarii]|uniref:Rhodanese-like domain-containing protein n=1 Tax=Nocardioides aestuarii TaxID=252231 RepID=A0ABW4TJJ2_9ACTN
MDVVPVPVPHLGNRCHLVHDGRLALVVDPPRDHRVVEAAAAAAGVEIAAVADTHVHNDYVSGAPLLARRHAADHLVAAAERVDVPRIGVHDGDVLAVGTLRVEVIDTPGHTHHHQSFHVTDRAHAGAGGAVLSGGSLLHGTVGRTDLLGPEHTLDLARAQWWSARRLATLPTTTALLPTHGFGSFCAGGDVAGTGGASVTLGHQLVTNAALTTNREEFVARLVAGYGPVPTYYSHMGGLNRAGRGAEVPAASRPVTADQVTDALRAGQWVIDVRDRALFAEAHLEGAVSVEHTSQFATYVGWLVPWQDDIVLLGDEPGAIAAAVRELESIGIEGVATHALAPGHRMPAGYRRARWEDLAALGDPPVVLDVRRHDEFDAGHLTDARHIPLHELEMRIPELPDGEIWVHCRSGFRAGTAASLLQRAGRAVVHLDDDWDRVPAVHLSVDGAAAA